MASISTVFLLLFISFVGGRIQAKQSSHITLGSSLSPSTDPTSWLSPSSRFAFGFYQQGDAGFAVGIWMVGKNDIKDTVVWTAKRDDPPITSKAKLVLTQDGIFRTDHRGTEKLIANETAASVSHASMLDSGNFVLYSSKDSKNIIWQSFDHPTDTILGGQTLFSGDQLFSSSTETNHSTGRFRLNMQDDGNLVLYPVHTTDTGGEASWSSDTFGDGFKFHLYLNITGDLRIINGTDLLHPDPIHSYNRLARPADTLFSNRNINNNNDTIYRATLDTNGVFRLYSHAYNESGQVSELWSSSDDQCDVKGFCGFNSFCTFDDNKPICRCLLGTDFVDANDPSLGCERNYTEAECRGGKENATIFSINSMDNMTWGGHPYFKAPMSTEECNNSCLEDCNCEAALFRSGSCMKQKLPLRYVRRLRDTQTSPSTAFLKMGMRSIERINKTDRSPENRPPTVMVTTKRAIVEILLVTVGFTILSCVALAISGLYIFKTRVLRYKRLLENGNLGVTDQVTLRLFSYNELKRATNGFKEELGKGSFGAVYKGALYKGKKLVAVKRLEKLIEEGEREFQAEMRAIGRTHHRNLVRLLGYCTEDSKRLLVYEYMSNGSLADLLFRAERRPDWNDRVRIALDVARGILYLHEECEAPIIHCDIKPQNILMDEFWNAKISDFGLAKLLMPDQTRTFTVIRGTRGYLAPEWHKNIPISVKADVYGYGIVLLEILCCRRNMEITVTNADEILLSTWVYKCFVARELDKIVKGEEVEKTRFENMVKVALWCIQDETHLRPSMKSVVLMLEGITDIAIPPQPTTPSM